MIHQMAFGLFILPTLTEFEMLLMQSGWSIPEAARSLGYSEGHLYRWKRGDEVPREAVMKLLMLQSLITWI